MKVSGVVLTAEPCGVVTTIDPVVALAPALDTGQVSGHPVETPDAVNARR